MKREVFKALPTYRLGKKWNLYNVEYEEEIDQKSWNKFVKNELKVPKFICDKCNQECASASALQSHKETDHRSRIYLEDFLL